MLNFVPLLSSFWMAIPLSAMSLFRDALNVSISLPLNTDLVVSDHGIVPTFSLKLAQSPPSSLQRAHYVLPFSDISRMKVVIK